MPRQRFASILAFLLENIITSYIEYGQDGHDPIHKIGPSFSYLQAKFQALCVLEQEICVDEAVFPFKRASHICVHT